MGCLIKCAHCNWDIDFKRPHTQTDVVDGRRRYWCDVECKEDWSQDREQMKLELNGNSPFK